ncbi:phage tail protein [Salmonella enterica]|nr:phage tail protein [Salmonella enterica]MBH0603297.1 phage tail protein [Salmonella enterica]MBH0611919.1 phage tail protein [Salmonella enterica]
MAESQFYAILTDQGAALEATALATGIPVTLDKFVIGDGGGNAVTPDPTRTTLVNEVYRGTIQKAESQGNQVTFTLYVPPEAGGYTIREAGILTADGTLYSLSNSPDILKPTESNGAVISITFKYILAVSSTSTVTVVVYDDYLTPEAADAKYLQISKNLSEIASNGDEAKSSARKNIGIDGDIAYRDKVNVFTSKNTFNNTVDIAEGEEALIRVIRIMYDDVDNGYLSGQLNKVVKLRADGKLHLSAPSLDGLRFLTDSDEYEVYHSGNLKPVLSVNNSKPDTNGNVTISTGSTVDLSNYYTKSEVNALISGGDYASATPGAVKSYGLFTTYMTVTEGNTITGASIYYTGISGGEGGLYIARGSQPAGIWKIMGKTENVNGAFFAVRIS